MKLADCDVLQKLNNKVGVACVKRRECVRQKEGRREEKRRVKSRALVKICSSDLSFKRCQRKSDPSAETIDALADVRIPSKCSSLYEGGLIPI